MKAGFTGSRAFINVEPVYLQVAILAPDTEIVTGCARGVDSAALWAAQRLGLKHKKEVADWEGFGKKAGMLRNQRIVDQVDVLFAFPGDKSVGTFDCMRRAEKKGIPVVTYSEHDYRENWPWKVDTAILRYADGIREIYYFEKAPTEFKTTTPHDPATFRCTGRLSMLFLYDETHPEA